MLPRLFTAALLFWSAALVSAESVDELIKRAEPYDERMQAKVALPIYQEAEKLEPKNVEVLTRIARQYRHLMADETNKNEKIRLGRTALEFSQRAAALGPNDPDAQLSVAISLGKLTPLLGTKEQVTFSPRVKAALDKTLALDPRNDTAWHILGRWNRVLSEVSPVKRAIGSAIYGKLPQGSIADAEQALRKALALNPQRLMHHIELGRILARSGKKEEAKQAIKRGLAMPNREKDDPDTKELGKQALAKL